MDAQEPFQIVAFYSAQIPAYFDSQDPGGTAQRLAMEQLGLTKDDFKPGNSGRYNGNGRYGFHFEIAVRRTASQGLLSRNHPNVLEIFD